MEFEGLSIVPPHLMRMSSYEINLDNSLNLS